MSSTDSGSFVGAFVDVPVNEICRSLTQALIDGDNTAHVFIPMDQMALKNMATKFNQLYQMTCLQSESDPHSPDHHHNKERRKEDNGEESLIEDASPIDAISSPKNDFESLCNILEEVDDNDVLLQDSNEDVVSTTSNVEYDLQPNLTEVKLDVGLLGNKPSEPLNEAEKTGSLVNNNVSYESEEKSLWNADKNNNTYKENKPLEIADSIFPKVDHVKRDSITFTPEKISSLAKLFVNELFSSDLPETLSSQPKVPVVPDMLSESKDIPVSQSKLKGTVTQVNSSNKTDDKSLVEDRKGQFDGLRYHDIKPVSDYVEMSNCIDSDICEQAKSDVNIFSNMVAHRRKTICSPLIENKNIAIATINSTQDPEALSTNPESCSIDGIHASNKKVITISENTNTVRKQSHACLSREDASRSDSVHIKTNVHHSSRTLHTEEDGCAVSNSKPIKAAKRLLPFDYSMKKKRKIYEVENNDDTENDRLLRKIPTSLHTTHMIGDNNIYVDSFCCGQGWVESNASGTVETFGEKYVPVVSYTSPNSWNQVKDRKLWPHEFYFTVGFHPLHSASIQFRIGQLKKELKRYVTDKKCIGVTAVGLDYYSGITMEAKKDQLCVFHKMVNLATTNKKPLSVYATGVGAQEDVLRMLKNNLSRKHSLCVHYTGESKEEISKWLNLFPKAKFAVSSSILKHGKQPYEQSLRYIEMSKLLVESSDPTKVCDLNFNPMLIKELVAYLAKIKNYPTSLFCSFVAGNFYRHFGVSAY